jgi:hypothetical protein
MARAARKEPTVRELDERLTKVEGRLDALEEPALETGLEKLKQTVREGFAEHTALINLLLKQRADDRALADQRHDALSARMDNQHAAVMAQFEKLLAKPSEN